MQWLNLFAWKVGDCGFFPHSVFKFQQKQNVFSPLTRKDSTLWESSVIEINEINRALGHFCAHIG